MRRCGGGDSGSGSGVLGAAGCGRGSACSSGTIEILFRDRCSPIGKKSAFLPQGQ